MTSPIKPTLGKMDAKVTPKGNLPMLLFMLGAGAITYKLSRDTYVGNEARESQGVAAERTKKDYSLLMYDAGSFSGKGPFWDSVRHVCKSLDLYGPYGIKEDYQEFRDKVHSIWKEVVIPNLIPIGITVASIYGYFGPAAVHKPFRYVGRTFAKAIADSGCTVSLPKLAHKAGTGIVDGCAKVLTQALKHPAIATGALFLSAFGLKSLYEVNTGRAQDEYFRHELAGADGKEE
jgi:hypothetical protein